MAEFRWISKKLSPLELRKVAHHLQKHATDQVSTAEPEGTVMQLFEFGPKAKLLVKRLGEALISHPVSPPAAASPGARSHLWKRQEHELKTA